MKFRRFTALVLGIAAAAAVGLCVCIYTGEDREAPVITFGTELQEISADADDAAFLADVSATDNKDGNLSDQVQIAESSRSEEELEIVYVVKDSSGNVALKRRVIPLDGAGEEEESQPVETIPETEEVETVPEITEEETEEETETETESAEEETTVSEVPIIALTQNHVTLPVGTEFVYSSFVASVTDDKDNYNELFRNLVVTGRYNVNVPGEYTLEYWVMDSDGHQSERQPFLLTIE